NGAKADELAPADLDDCAVERRGVDLVRADRLAVQPDPALVDLAAPVARRAAELRLEDRRQIDDAVARRKRRFRHLGGRLMPAHDPCEMVLAGFGAGLAVPPLGDPARELELPFERAL